MLKKATILLIIFTLVISFSMTAFASDTTDTIHLEDGEKVIYTPGEPIADGYSDSGKGLGPHNPLYVGGE